MGNNKWKGPRKTKLEVVFDPDARREFLLGFSKRKAERRRHGLAMQKVKDRKAKLAQRQEMREAKKAAVPELPVLPEKQPKGEDAEPEVLEFRDGFTQQRFGDAVTVTTYLGVPGAPEGEESSAGEEEEQEGEDVETGSKNFGRGMDEEQKRAGSLEHFKRRLAGHMPAKRKKPGAGTKKNTTGSFNPKKGKGAGGKETSAQTRGPHRIRKKR